MRPSISVEQINAALDLKAAVGKSLTVENAPCQTSLELLYGKSGVPETDEVKLLTAPTPDPKDKKLGEKQRRVSIMKDHSLEYPDLWLEVFIAGPKWEEQAFVPMFTRAHCRRAATPADADLVVFVGGADVDPKWYDESVHKTTKFHEARDLQDIKIYLECLENGIPMLGVCRGMQFLHVMNGGKLYQDVDGHYGDHSMYDTRNQRLIPKVSSVHHQMVRPNPSGKMEVLGVTAGKSATRALNAESFESGSNSDIEAIFYRDTCCIGVQGHPEYAGYNQYTKWVLDTLNDLIVMNPDIEWIDSSRRMKKDLIGQREEKAPKGVKARLKKLLQLVEKAE